MHKSSICSICVPYAHSLLLPLSSDNRVTCELCEHTKDHPGPEENQVTNKTSQSQDLSVLKVDHLSIDFSPVPSYKEAQAIEMHNRVLNVKSDQGDSLL